MKEDINDFLENFYYIISSLLLTALLILTSPIWFPIMAFTKIFNKEK
jgi:hypothetical protein